MGDVAASGGYWVAPPPTNSSPTRPPSPAGSACSPCCPRPKNARQARCAHRRRQHHLAGRAATTRVAAWTRVFARWCRRGVDHVYRTFIASVATRARPRPTKIDAVAQGRVWAGLQARDVVWSIAWAAWVTRSSRRSAASCPGPSRRGDYRITYLEREPGRLQRLVELFGVEVFGHIASRIDARAAERRPAAHGLAPLAALPLDAAREMQSDLLGLRGADTRPQALPVGGAIACASDP